MGDRWRAAFKKRNGIRFRKIKRVITLDKTEVVSRIHSFHSYTQRIWDLLPLLAYAANADETPLAFNGDQSGRMVMLEDESTAASISFGDRNPNEIKRFATWLPCITVPWDSKVEHWSMPKPIIIFGGEGKRITSQERTQWAKGVDVRFQPSAVTDSVLMADIYRSWAKHFPKPTLLLLDEASQHWTTTAKEGRGQNTVFAKIPGKVTCIVQFLDLYYFHDFKAEYRTLFSEIQPTLRADVSASQKRVIMTRLALRAHQRVIQKLLPRIREQFTALGYFPTDPTKIQLRALPDYHYAPDVFALAAPSALFFYAKS